MSTLLSEAAQRLIDEHRASKQQAADSDLDELLAEPDASGLPSFKAGAKAAAAAVRRPPYTAAAMVDLMIAHPEYSHAQFAAHFGYKASWFAGVLISNNFQAALEQRRSEVSNPMLTGTMDDLFRSITVQALTVLQARLDSPQASEDLIIKAIATGVKALGMGTANAPPPAVAAPSTLADLAHRLSGPAKDITPADPLRDYTIPATLDEIPR